MGCFEALWGSLGPILGLSGTILASLGPLFGSARALSVLSWPLLVSVRRLWGSLEGVLASLWRLLDLPPIFLPLGPKFCRMRGGSLIFGPHSALPWGGPGDGHELEEYPQQHQLLNSFPNRRVLSGVVVHHVACVSTSARVPIQLASRG